MNAATVLLDAVDVRWRKYRSELKTCREEFSEEAVHDLRVAARRLLAVFDLLRSVIHHPRVQRIRRALKAQLDDLDDLRDVQVLLADISEFVHEVHELGAFREYLHAREKKLLRAARKQVKSIKTGGLSKRVEKVRGMVESLTEQELEESLYESLDDAFARAARYYAVIDMDKTATIHKLRIAFKKLRYMIEIIHPLMQNLPPENFQKMHDYQSMMGDIQDMEIALQQFADWKESDSTPDFETIHHHYTARLKKCLFNYFEDKGELLTFWRAAPDQSFPWEK